MFGRGRRFEVAVRGSERATVPDGLCTACGRRFGVDANRAGRRLELPFAQPKTAVLPKYRFPLCEECARAHAARDPFLAVGGALGALSIVALAVAGAIEHPERTSVGEVINTLIIILFAGGLGAGVGLALAWLLGFVVPVLGAASRVSRAVDYVFESYKMGYGVDDYRTFFLFANDDVARAFAAANLEILMPPRPRARLAEGTYAPAVLAGTTPRQDGWR